MNWPLTLYLAGVAAIAVWTRLEIRRETPGGKVLLVVLGSAVALFWPFILACAVLIVLCWAIRPVRGIDA